MYFALSKVAGFALTPSNVIGGLCLVGLILIALRLRRVGGALLSAGVVLLALVGWSPVANWLYLSLSERFPAYRDDGRRPDGIIVLGGAIDPEVSAARGMPEINGNAERLFVMMDFARRYPDMRIVYSGGSAALVGEGVAEAPVAGRMLDEFGLARGRVTLENDSRTTEENALRTREAVTPKPGERWLLVTSAYHMPRAIGLYRKAGFEVTAYPVDFRGYGWSGLWRPFRQLSWGLERADVAVHEWLGLFAARLNGSSDELFPGPR